MDKMSCFDAKKELLRDLEHYFTRQFSDKDKKQILYYLDKYDAHTPPVIVKEIIERIVAAPNTEELPPVCNLDELALAVCSECGISIDQLRMSSPVTAYFEGRRGKRQYVSARQLFARRSIAAGLTMVEVRDFIGYACHSSVNHLVNHRKIRRSKYGSLKTNPDAKEKRMQYL